MHKDRGDRAAVTKSNRHDFFKYYADLCQFHNLNPSHAIKHNLKNVNLNLCGDRVRSEDWQLITKALSSDLCLESIHIWSRYCRINSAFLTEGFKRKAQLVKNIPPLLSPKILSSLISAVAKCLQNSKTISILRLNFLPLLTHDSKLLSETIGYCSSLEHLSLSHCCIGDETCIALCKALKGCLKLKTLNLSGCSISSIGVYAVATLIKEHSLSNFNEIWSNTLRQTLKEIPEKEEGLKRVTLNQNPLIGDLGIDHLAMILLDDLCIKAIDLQDCGISNVGGEILKCLLQVNKILRVVDVRYNENLEFSIFDDILNLLINNNADATQWEWLKMDPFIAFNESLSIFWSKYDGQFPFCKIDATNSIARSQEETRGICRTPIPRNKIFGIARKRETAKSRQKNSKAKFNPSQVSNEDCVLVEKNMLLEISATLKKINFFIRRLNLPQLISILKDLKTQTEQLESTMLPESNILKESSKEIVVDQDWSEDSNIHKRVDEIFKRPLKKTNSFDSSKKCSCCEKVSRDLQTQSDFSVETCQAAVKSSDKLQTRSETTGKRPSELFDLLRKYGSLNNQNVPAT